MKYDFTTLIDRSTHGSGKWDGMREKKPELKYSPVPLSVADMEFRNPPEIAEGLKEFMDTHILGYTGPTREYYDAVCAWMERRHNWHIEPDWIVGTHGVVEALKVSVEAFCKPGEGVITFTPVYYPFYMAIENHGCEIARCPLRYQDNAYTIDFGLFEKLCSEENNKMFLLCSPHNPVGRVWSAEELTRICDICRKHKVRIISDEIHFDIIMPGFKHTTIHNVAKPSDNIIVCTAPARPLTSPPCRPRISLSPMRRTESALRRYSALAGPRPLVLRPAALPIPAVRSGQRKWSRSSTATVRRRWIS